MFGYGLVSEVSWEHGLFWQNNYIIEDEGYCDIIFEWDQKKISTHVIFELKAERLMKSECEGYIAIIKVDKESKGVEENPMVCEFQHFFFPEEIPRLPPIKEMGSTIEPAADPEILPWGARYVEKNS